MEGEVIEAPEAPQPAKVMDLMEALRASVEQAKKSRAAQGKPTAAEAKRTRRKAS
jgi:non-homologous end joining protein Ku